MATEPTTDLMFIEEPPHINTTGRGRTSPVTPWLARLREHPGRWAEYPQSFLSNSVAYRINHGDHGKPAYGVQPGEFEATMRRNGKAYTLYARYVGGES